MPTAIPSLDNNICSAWTENDRNMYNSYDFFLAKMQVGRRPWWQTFTKLVKKKPWTPNHGPLMRGIRTNMAPILRQYAAPELLTTQPTEDIYNVTETRADAPLFWHDFTSPVMYFLPSFNDFLDHITDTGKTIMEQMEVYEETFYRWNMFQMCPFVLIARGNSAKVVQAPAFDGLSQWTTAKGKSTAWLANLIATEGPTMSPLTLRSLQYAQQIMETDLGIPSWSGSDDNNGDDKPLEGKYLLVTSNEAYTNFTFDPYLVAAKNCQLDIVQDRYYGNIFGCVTARKQAKPLWMKADGTFAAPEVRVEDPGNLTWADNETQPNPEYTNILPIDPDNNPTQCSPFEISFLGGEIGYDAIDSGPPPSQFTKDTPPHQFPGMRWNGEVYLTKDFLLECPDAVTGAIRYKTNNQGKYLKYQAEQTYGIFPRQRRSVIPIIHKRQRGGV